MKKIYLLFFSALVITFFTTSFKTNTGKDVYINLYDQRIGHLKKDILLLSETIEMADPTSEDFASSVKKLIVNARNSMKATDFWTRYLEPITFKSINGPLPVEWETEVFEKFEKPYRRDGAGLTLAEQYLEEKDWKKDSLLNLVNRAVSAIDTYKADSITHFLDSYHHFYLCNRLFLLNLATIYTTGFDCPDSNAVIPELATMCKAVSEVYEGFNNSFPQTALPPAYLLLYNKTIEFINAQGNQFSHFDHYHFIRDYINPLFRINQQLINEYRVISRSFMDYSINKSATSIFNKDLYRGQNPKGVFLRVDDKESLRKIDSIGKLFFYDPILSVNNQRSCASCHKPTEYFTDTSRPTSPQLNNKDVLRRNSPSLINAEYNHLAMLDGKHISLQNQAKDVISNPIELGTSEKELMKKVTSCPDYKRALKLLLSYTPELEEISIDHIVSAITVYYCKFSKANSPFDAAINGRAALNTAAEHGFNLFMGKAQCGTCHFAPQFNGVKPPYVGSEFEVLGVPADTAFSRLSDDKGRYEVYPADETLHAFRTGSLRNISRTAPYMHNGVFKTLEQVIDFYDAGGGSGKGLQVPNQTLASDSLRLTVAEKKDLVTFMKSLDEGIVVESPPAKLPRSTIALLNERKVGGKY